MALDETTRQELVGLTTKYPQPRSALNPMLHLVQSVEGYVSPAGIEMCAEVLGLSAAEVAGVATFYTMYKRRPVGDHHIGICVNPQCGILGGDAIFAALSEDLGIGNDETTDDGKITIERIECQAACTYAPSCTVDWEFMDDMSVDKMRDVVAKLRAGKTVTSTRGPDIRSFRATERSLSGIDDGLGDAGGNTADAVMLRGLTVARELDMASPFPEGGAQ
jgi:NADH-quinone oxidoreductase subunit E